MIKRYLITLLLVIAASSVVYSYYQSYSSNPWTRDGQVSAYIVSITPRVTGQVTKVHIEDNSQVAKGDLLFEIDPSIYQAAYNKALATQKQARALLAKAKNEEQRALNLEKRTPGAMPVLTLNNLNNAVETNAANVALAKANVEEAHLNLEYTKVYAPTNGYITNLNLREGSQVVANTPVVALIDEDSFWIEGYFKETDLVNVGPNDKALITLMMHNNIQLEGHIKSIGFGIATQDGSTGNDLLPNVNPNFQWIRLAQRIPVKVELDNVPEDLQLRVGMTASLKIIK
ncbi:RND efflux pump membrane fusion protein barrel-sandwich domain-containing protein [Vibrio crassostreae]|uniref:HlyD family secretion protein n=1 Tax=Vibrio crassostreae TaxID=246167 RepID=UPI001B300F5B|nr:HlyD family secretion protein [Vibrio crassostreae]CAK2046726.1 RND efflux pump membrane fusion protein barrel-sandwich domain-containing protein [Vibrio crassostreae]CAK2111617.1 RND efflux pump membrane fusion protein barrel-sandwich domain-containing protein [Vibrio crassostreae]CAK2816306.1 RND efflux pump membrane fusion protein barrel-sandwich domain-containing protein [Vibrio crassostreae]CAK2863415.1 RND efflux pump membrane fusion protein barrel-sandwich domain-containing protein [V